MKPWEQRARALSERAPRNARVAELGFGAGRMAGVLAAIRPDLRLVMVDNFLPGDEQPAHYRATRDTFAHKGAGDVLNRCRMAQEMAHRAGWDFLRMDSAEAASRFADGAFDVVFIDADHSYEGVRRDLAAWLPKVVEGGYLGGHDYGNDDPRWDFSGVKRAVDEAFPAVETDANFTWWVRV